LPMPVLLPVTMQTLPFMRRSFCRGGGGYAGAL
jgi:hypothetical protein